MQIQFDSHQEHQDKAIISIVDIFANIPLSYSDYQLSFNHKNTDIMDDVIGNNLNIQDNKEQVLSNIHTIQDRNELPHTDNIRNFSIEMETWTGKTYCYLKTILELYTKYNQKKFIIVVPSIAIRAWVIKSLEMTKIHFATLYPWVRYDYYDYDSNKIDKMKDFYMSDSIQIMVMTAHSFSADDRIIHQKGRESVGEHALIKYIAQTKPIMILDEPQSILWPKTKDKIKDFHPLFTLYYSATHKEKFSLMYQLSPATAYNTGLVKKIQVLSINASTDENVMNVTCTKIENNKQGKLTCNLILLQMLANGDTKAKEMTCKHREILFDKTNNPIYRGRIIEKIDRLNNQITIANWWQEQVITVWESSISDNQHELIKQQITQTLKHHYNKRQELVNRGIKPLTLFFIDKVDNFINNGFIQSHFVQEMKKYISDDISAYYSYYFASKQKKLWEQAYFDTLWNNQSDREIEKKMYDLIMKEKEQLLSLDNKVEFIFSHSALREWRDNPNVFTICTLRNANSETEKRQSIGRWLRLPVNQDGVRVYDRNINALCVVVNQSYEKFCEDYQNNLIREWYSSYEAKKASEGIEKWEPKLVKPRIERVENKAFNDFRNSINRKTFYHIDRNTDQIIGNIIEKINTELQPYHIHWNNYEVTTVWIEITDNSVQWIQENNDTVYSDASIYNINSITWLINEELRIHSISLSRKTIVRIVKWANLIHLLPINPKQFSKKIAEYCADVIKHEYTQKTNYYLSEETYDIQSVLEPIRVYEHNAHYPKAMVCKENGLFETIMVDSNIEESFGENCNKESWLVQLFFKINDSSFKINTPVWLFTPDRWLLIKKNNEQDQIYFMVETKWTADESNLKWIEKTKISCAKRHFKVLKESLKVKLECDFYDKFDQFKKDAISRLGSE